MTQQSRSRQKHTSGSKPEGSKADFDFFPTLFYDDVEDIRNSVGLVHPLVWQSLLENTHDRSKLSNRNKDMKNVLPNARRKNTKEEFLDDQQPFVLIKKEKHFALDPRDVVAKTTLSAKKNEVLPTRKLRSSHKDTKPVHESRSVNDFSIENMDWYYEDENYYVSKYYDILSDHAIPERDRTKSNGTNAYTYLLLDPRHCKNRRNTSWIDFIYAIFYIGKGNGYRAFQHAKDTEKWLINKKTGTGKEDKKFQKIEEIWASRNPIMVFKITESITDNEAVTREAAMIDAMGLRRLRNKRRSHYGLGRAVMLKARERCELGATLLIEAWDIFRKKEANVTNVEPKKKEIFDLFFVKEANCNSDSDDEDELCTTD